MLHQFFAASAELPEAQMAMGYRHLMGHAVPKSCQAAVLYYHPPAERVVEELCGRIAWAVEDARDAKVTPGGSIAGAPPSNPLSRSAE